MFKNLSKKIVAGLMITLMVIGVFLAISNFIADNSYAGGNGYDAELKCKDKKNYLGCHCDTTHQVDCVIVHVK